MNNTLNKKKKFNMPSTYVIIFMIMILAFVLTYVIPSGIYEMDEATGLVDASSFTFTEQKTASITDFFLSFYNGLMQGSGIIFLILTLGGFFQIINDTGAIDAGIYAAASKLKEKRMLIIPIFYVILYVLGSLHVLSNAAVVFIPIGIVMCKRLKLDPLAVLGVVFLSTHVGFAASPMGPFNVIVAQEIAGLPILSGFGLRFIVWLALLIVTLAFVYRYAKKISNDPSKSAIGVYTDTDEDLGEVPQFNWRHGVILIVMAVGFGAFAYGAYYYGWGADVMSGIMFFLALVSAIIGRISPNKVSSSFIDGVKSVATAAMIVGLATSIRVLLESGEIIHTLIYYATIPLVHLPKAISAILMFFINAIFNFAVPSASGQAAIVMPIMAPMADILGITRQVAALATQFGDGFTNLIIPTGGTTMACIALAGVPYNKWLKWIMPLFGVIILIGCIAIAVAVTIGWA